MPKPTLDDVNSMLTNKRKVLGADEVGYGCLAGPLVVCGVLAPKDWNLDGLNDSKKLSKKRREEMRGKLNKPIQDKVISFHLAERSNEIIDEKGVAWALKDAYLEVFAKLHQTDCLIISDGILKFDTAATSTYDMVSLIKADAQIPAVMAASIIAKTYRDEKMRVYGLVHTEYGWKSNAGYGSKDHISAIFKYGPTPLHRMSYAPLNDPNFAVEQIRFQEDEKVFEYLDKIAKDGF